MPMHVPRPRLLQLDPKTAFAPGRGLGARETHGVIEMEIGVGRGPTGK
jgi:hypothetical protein